MELLFFFTLNTIIRLLQIGGIVMYETVSMCLKKQNKKNPFELMDIAVMIVLNVYKVFLKSMQGVVLKKDMSL